LLQWEVGGIASRSCPVAVLGISHVESLHSVMRELGACQEKNLLEI